MTTDVTTEPVTEPSSELPSPPVSDVEMPEVLEPMSEDSVDGAGLSAWYFLRVWNYARATGDTTTFATLFGESCNWCAEQVEGVEVIYAAGCWIEGGQATFDIGTALVEFPSDENAFYAVRMDVDLAPYTVHLPDQPPTEGAAETMSPIAIAVQYNGSGFTVVAVNYAVA